MPGVFVLSYVYLRRREMGKQKIKRRCIRDASDPLSIPDEEFTKLYRLNKEAFCMVLDDIAPLINRGSIPETIQLAAAVRFVAVGAFQGVVANDVNICLARTTFSKVFWRVMDALERTLCSKWIQLELSEDDKRASKLYFYEKCGLPGVIGCVDGTHLRIIKPSTDDDSLYYNRKGFYSLNVMIICDFKMRILAVDGCRPGSCHDAFIWRMSEARQFLRTKYQDGERNDWLLGDSGYGLEPFLMTLYSNPQFGAKEHIFNKKHCSGRNIVERTIGNLKSRFRCIQCTTLHYSPPKVVKIVKVCSALHNICKHFNIPDVVDLELNEEFDDDDYPAENDGISPDIEGIRMRDAIANSLSR